MQRYPTVTREPLNSHMEEATPVPRDSSSLPTPTHTLPLMLPHCASRVEREDAVGVGGGWGGVGSGVAYINTGLRFRSDGKVFREDPAESATGPAAWEEELRQWQDYALALRNMLKALGKEPPPLPSTRSTLPVEGEGSLSTTSPKHVVALQRCESPPRAPPVNNGPPGPPSASSPSALSESSSSRNSTNKADDRPQLQQRTLGSLVGTRGRRDETTGGNGWDVSESVSSSSTSVSVSSGDLFRPMKLPILTRQGEGEG